MVFIGDVKRNFNFYFKVLTCFTENRIWRTCKKRSSLVLITGNSPANSILLVCQEAGKKYFQFVCIIQTCMVTEHYVLSNSGVWQTMDISGAKGVLQLKESRCIFVKMFLQFHHTYSILLDSSSNLVLQIHFFSLFQVVRHIMIILLYAPHAVCKKYRDDKEIQRGLLPMK